MHVVKLDGVSKSFKGHQVLREVSLTMEEGLVYGLRGRNGSGKSVLLQTICGFYAPDSGSVQISPKYMTDGRTFPDQFGVLINGPAYVAGLTALENLKDLAAIRKRATDDDLREMLKVVGLDPLSRKKARTFSSGMKQKLGLAQALIEDPKVLILDEPFNALDEASIANVKSVLRAFVDEGGTILFSSHNDADFTELATSIFDLTDGSVTERAV